MATSVCQVIRCGDDNAITSVGKSGNGASRRSEDTPTLLLDAARR